MIATLKAKSQVTIPSSIVKQAGLAVGDAFDIVYKGGNIVLIPMAYVTRKDADALSLSKEMDASMKICSRATS